MPKSIKKYLFKILLLGPSSVGKTSLLNRFVNNAFSEDFKMTIGVDFLSKKMTNKTEEMVLSIWDIGGQERFRFLARHYYMGTNGLLLVFDLSRKDSFKKMEEWLSEAYEILEKKIPILLIGNKLDLIDDADVGAVRKDALDFARAHKTIYIETSAKTGENVEEAFIKLTNRMINFQSKGNSLFF